jgi:AraC-like DNA-binding protein
MIVLKDLAREFDMDPHKVRAILRDKFGEPRGRRWRWDEDDRQLTEARKLLGNGSSKSPE